MPFYNKMVPYVKDMGMNRIKELIKSCGPNKIKKQKYDNSQSSSIDNFKDNASSNKSHSKNISNQNTSRNSNTHGNKHHAHNKSNTKNANANTITSNKSIKNESGNTNDSEVFNIENVHVNISICSISLLCNALSDVLRRFGNTKNKVIPKVNTPEKQQNTKTNTDLSNNSDSDSGNVSPVTSTSTPTSTPTSNCSYENEKEIVQKLSSLIDHDSTTTDDSSSKMRDRVHTFETLSTLELCDSKS